MRKNRAGMMSELAVADRPRAAASTGWEQAVCSATARLNEGWVLEETKCHSAVAEELAAFMCAYAA